MGHRMRASPSFQLRAFIVRELDSNRGLLRHRRIRSHRSMLATLRQADKLAPTWRNQLITHFWGPAT
jgi:hypothetical protein